MSRRKREAPVDRSSTGLFGASLFANTHPATYADTDTGDGFSERESLARMRGQAWHVESDPIDPFGGECGDGYGEL